MANTELVRLAPDAPMERVIAAVNAIVDAKLGNVGARVLMVGHDGTATDPNLNTSAGTGLYQTVIRSSGANHLQVRQSDDSVNRLTVTDAATTTPDLVASTTLNSQGSTTIGTSSANTLTVNALGTFAALATFNAGATFTAPVTGNGTLQFKGPTSAAASAALTLTTTPASITGAAVNLAPGAWKVTGVYDMVGSGAGDVGQILLGTLVTSGGAASIALPTASALWTVHAATNCRATVSQTWLVTVTASTTAALQGAKTGGAGTSVITTTHTTITATNA